MKSLLFSEKIGVALMLSAIFSQVASRNPVHPVGVVIFGFVMFMVGFGTWMWGEYFE